jgi:cysteinyl-tRNA synthetase
MAMKYLGTHFDIHGGGQDLIFPHHENEIAQSEAATDQPFANFWAENGMVNLSGEKMSKSTGKLFFIEDIVREADPEVVRYYLLSTHYRSPIEFSQERLAEAAVAYQRLRSPLERTHAWEGDGDGTETAGSLGEAVAQADRLFHEAMDDDFNTPLALAGLYELVKAINTARDNGASEAQLEPAQATLRELTGVLGLRLQEKQGSGDADKFIDLLVQVRGEVRKQKLWQLSDLIRDQLKELGVAIEDTKEGTKWRWS